MTLVQINAMSRKQKNVESLHSTWSKLNRLLDWRRDIEFAYSWQHDTIIEMSDAVTMSIVSAIKIAEQNKPSDGHVYFLLNPLSNLVKIGWSINLYDRLKTLESQSGQNMTLVGAVRSQSNKKEREFHRRFKQERVKGEWFNYQGKVKTFCWRQFGFTQRS